LPVKLGQLIIFKTYLLIHHGKNYTYQGILLQAKRFLPVKSRHFVGIRASKAPTQIVQQPVAQLP